MTKLSDTQMIVLSAASFHVKQIMNIRYLNRAATVAIAETTAPNPPASAAT